MKITIDNTTLEFTSRELVALDKFADGDPQYTGTAHLIEMHISRLVDAAIKTYPDDILKAEIEALNVEANERLSRIMESTRSARPLEQARVAAQKKKSEDPKPRSVKS